MANTFFVYLLMFSMMVSSYQGYMLNSPGDDYGDESYYDARDDEDADGDATEENNKGVHKKVTKADFRALEAKKKFQKHIPLSSKFYNCNSNKMYYEDEYKLYQYNLDATGKKRIDLVVEQIYYVDDHWLYYRAGKKFWRVPVKQSGRGQEFLDVKKKQCMIKDYKEYGNDKYIKMDSENLYYQDKDTLVEIDLKSGKSKKRSISGQINGKWQDPSEVGMTKDVIYVKEHQSLYMVERGSLKITTLFAGNTERLVENYSLNTSAVLNKNIYYMIEQRKRGMGDYYDDDDYDPVFNMQEFMVWNGKRNESVLTQKQLREAICQCEGIDPDKEDAKTRIESLFAYKGKIYLFYELKKGESDVQVGVLIYEPGKELTTDQQFKTFYQFLNQKDYDFYEIDYFVAGRVYLSDYVSDDEYISDCYVYDFSLGQYQTMPEKEYGLLWSSQDVW